MRPRVASGAGGLQFFYASAGRAASRSWLRRPSVTAQWWSRGRFSPICRFFLCSRNWQSRHAKKEPPASRRHCEQFLARWRTAQQSEDGTTVASAGPAACEPLGSRAGHSGFAVPLALAPLSRPPPGGTVECETSALLLSEGDLGR